MEYIIKFLKENESVHFESIEEVKVYKEKLQIKEKLYGSYDDLGNIVFVVETKIN